MCARWVVRVPGILTGYLSRHAVAVGGRALVGPCTSVPVPLPRARRVLYRPAGGPLSVRVVRGRWFVASPPDAGRDRRFVMSAVVLVQDELGSSPSHRLALSVHVNPRSHIAEIGRLKSRWVKPASKHADVSVGGRQPDGLDRQAVNSGGPPQGIAVGGGVSNCGQGLVNARVEHDPTPRAFVVQRTAKDRARCPDIGETIVDTGRIRRMLHSVPICIQRVVDTGNESLTT